MYFECVDGYGYIREKVNGQNETVAKIGYVGDNSPMFRPKLVHDTASNLLDQLPDNSIDLIITDPPFGVSTRVGRSQYNGQYEASAHERGRIRNHNGLDFLEGIPQEFERVMKADSHLYVFCNYESYPEMRAYFDEVFDLSQLLVWEKPTYGVGDPETYSPVHEFIMHFRYGSPELRYGDETKRPKNVLTFKRTANNNEIVAHATQKPIELMDFLIKRSSDVGDLVLDPFGGSFATGRAAQHTFRRAVCGELDPEITSDGRDLADYQLHNDPIYGVDWTEIRHIEVCQTEIPGSNARDSASEEVTADD